MNNLELIKSRFKQSKRQLIYFLKKSVAFEI